jgi:RNA polymerase sigma-70 factor (sigma-E family)
MTLDDRDYDEFVRSRADALLRLAYLFTGDRHRAEDALQDVLEGMFVRWRHIRGSPDAYARRALANRAIGQARWRRRHGEAPLTDAAEPRVDDPAMVVSTRQAVLAVLGELTGRQRASVVLRYLEELSIAEVADILGCSEGSVKSHCARGLAKLRHAMQRSNHGMER